MRFVDGEVNRKSNRYFVNNRIKYIKKIRIAG